MPFVLPRPSGTVALKIRAIAWRTVRKVVILQLYDKKNITPMRALLVTLLALWVASAPAQTFGTRWMAAPHADSTAAVWFRRTFVGTRRPLRGSVMVTTHGQFRLYFNGAHLSPSVVHSPMSGSHGGAATVTIDVTPYLRADSNTVALLYAPPRTGADSLQQVAVCYYGRDRSGRPFAHQADDGWLCRQAAVWLTPGGEYHDTPAEPDDGYGPQLALAAWAHPRATRQHDFPPAARPLAPPASMQIGAIRRPLYFDAVSDIVSYEFGTGFYGYVRLTLRGATRGQHLWVDGNEFVCTGQTDEQHYALFTPAYYRRVRVSGDAHFRPSQVQRVEGIALKPGAPSVYDNL